MLLTTADAPADAGPPPPGVAADAIVHAALTSTDGLLMGADDMSGSFEGSVNGMCVNCALANASEARRVFDSLADGGSVQMPLGETFFSPAFGMCVDRFGTPWMIMVDMPAAS